MGGRTIHSRDGKATCDLIQHGNWLDLADTWPGGVPAYGYSRLAWNGTIPVASYARWTVVAVVAVRATAGTDAEKWAASLIGHKAGGQVYTMRRSSPLYQAPGVYSYALRDGFGRDRTYLAQSEVPAAPGTLVPTFASVNFPIGSWVFVSYAIDSGSVTVCVDGVSEVNSTGGAVNNSAISHVSAPAFLKSDASSAANLDWDYAENGNLWPQLFLATMMVWSRPLSRAELMDLYGMLMYGAGYAPSRESLELWWIGRRDSTTAAHVATLPAYTNYYTARTSLPDHSGRGRHGKLYTNKATWDDVLDTNLIDSTVTPPNIYLPEMWYDSSVVYDGTNDYTKKKLIVNGQGVPTFS